MKLVLRLGSCVIDGVGLVGRDFDGRSVSPAADEFGGELLFASRPDSGRPQFVQVLAKGGDVLVELAVDHEGSIAGEEVRHGRDGKLAGLVGVAEQQFAGGERAASFRRA